MRFCPKCKTEKEESEFYAHRGNGGVQSYCKSCARQYSIDWAKQHPEVIKRRKKKYYDEHSEAIIKYVGKWQRDNREEVNKKNREFAYKCRVEALTHYGNGKLACIRCSESDIRCLSIDHINGGGNQHRRELGGKGIKLSQILRRQGFPEGYQTLCMNCQWKKRYENHEVGHE